MRLMDKTLVSSSALETMVFFLFGVIHPHICSIEQILRFASVFGIARDSEADTGEDAIELLIVDVKITNPPAYAFPVIAQGQNHKLIARDAVEPILVTDEFRDMMDKLQEIFISEVVAISIVDSLEIVQVHENQREAFLKIDALAHILAQGHAIPQSGQGI